VFAKDHVLFLHITTRIPGRKNDGMLRDVGGAGFPTFVAMSSKGEVLAKPRQRTIASFADALAEAAEIEGELAPEKGSDADAAVNELLRKLKLDLLVDPPKDRAEYLKCRDALSPEQRAEVEKRITLTGRFTSALSMRSTAFCAFFSTSNPSAAAFTTDSNSCNAASCARKSSMV
jgi:hypothetical protein